MKIVCMIRSLGFGGAERQFVGLATMLSERGHDVTALTYRRGSFYEKDLSGSGVKHISVELPAGLRGMRTLAGVLRDCNPDVVIAFMPGACIKASWVKWRYHLPYALIVSDRNLTTRFNPLDPLKYRLFRQAELWVPNSYAQAEYLKLHYPKMKERIVPVTNFCDTRYFKPDLERCEGKPLRIITTARLSPRKNVLGWLDAVAAVARRRDDFVVEWVGVDSQDRFFRKVSRRIRSLGLEDRFVLSPKTKDVLEVYRRADIFCLPSFYEGTPNALCEALSCGVPAICSNVSDNAVYVRDGRDGFLFDPANIAGMACALEKILDCTPAQRREMGRYGSELISQRMDAGAFTDAYESLLSTL